MGGEFPPPPADDFDTVEVVFEEVEEPPTRTSGQRPTPPPRVEPRAVPPSIQGRAGRREETVPPRPPESPPRAPRRTPVPSEQETWRPSSPPVIKRPRSSDDYPPWFVTAAWRALLSGDVNGAARHYRACVRRDAEDAEGWYGTAAVALVRSQSDEAAAAFVKGWVLDRAFPIGRFLRDVCPKDPDLWYRFAGALVAMRRKTAYHCADLALATVMAEDSSPHALRQRASRVRHNIAEALEARAASDLHSADGPRPSRSLSRALVQSLGIVLLLVVVAGTGLWVLRQGNEGRVAPPLPTTAGGAQPDTPSSPATRSSPSPLPDGAEKAPPEPEVSGSGAPRATPSGGEEVAPLAPPSVLSGDDDARAPSAAASVEATGGGETPGAPTVDETAGAGGDGNGSP